MEFNEYIIGGLDLRGVGFIPGQGEGIENIAIHGHLDLPARTGKTYQLWPGENGIEPYVRPDEIFHAGRDIMVKGYVRADSREQLFDNINTINQEFNAFTSEQELISKWGTRIVTVQKIDVVRLQGGWAEAVLSFREARPDVNGELPSSASGGYGIDGYSWADLGIIFLKSKSELNRPDSIKLEVSVYGYEFNRVQYHDVGHIDLELFIRKPTYEEISETIQNFAFLLGSPYRRILSMPDGSYRECFAKDGFSVKSVRVTSSECYAFIDVRLTEITRFKDYRVIGDDENMALGDSSGEAFNFIV